MSSREAKGLHMRHFLKLWRCWLSGTWNHVGHLHACRRAATRLESLERRWNLSAVLVVETVDAYWLIEDPTFESLAPTTSADALHGESLLAKPGHDEIEMGLPANVSPAAASGGALNTAESDLAWTLLNDLWDSEPDFFYADVLAMTFFSDTTMDSLIDSGLFDGSSDVGSFNDTEFLTSDFFGNTDVSGASGNDFLDFSPDSSNEFSNSNSGSDEVLADNFAVVETETRDGIAADKAEVASWSQRIDAQSFAMPGASRTPADESRMATVLPVRIVVGNNPTFEPSTRTDLETVLRDDPAAKSDQAIQPTLKSTVSTGEPKALDSFFSQFPTMLGMGTERSSLLRLIRGERGPAADNSDEASSDVEDASGSWSYSQWASLVGVAGLSAASLWKSGATDSLDERSTPPLRSKSNDKRPVAC